MTDQSARVEPQHSSAVSKWWYLAAGLALGSLAVLAVRFVSYHPEETHYHANLAVYVNGQREAFKNPQYYQEVKVCSLGDTTPAARAHMHDQQNGLVHVHDEAVTWGQFFANLGWTIGPDFIRNTDGLYTSDGAGNGAVAAGGDSASTTAAGTIAEDGANRLNIILNDQNLTGISSIANQVIEDKDRLLISYGKTDAAGLQRQFSAVPADALEYNARQDPASCAGAHGVTVKDRLRHLF